MASACGDGAAPDSSAMARAAHRTLEPMHAISYFVPEHAERYAALGVKDGERGYFAARSAPLGRVPLEVVVATFYNFCPATVAKAIPSVWDVTTPEAVTEARYAATDAAYRRVLGGEIVESEQMAEAAGLAREATTVLTPEGRPLYAGHASLAWPAPPHLQLFHALTLLREHRGDGHIAALVLAGLDGPEALVSYAPLGKVPVDMLRATRGWPDADWDAAADRLRARGLLDEAGNLTANGTAQREDIEARTDASAAAPYLHLGADKTTRLRDLVRPWARTISTEIFGTLA